MTAPRNRLVIDTSVAVKWYLRDEELLAEADRLFADWTGGRWIFIAPGHFPYELAAAILRAERRRRAFVRGMDDVARDIATFLPRLLFVDPSRTVTGGMGLAASLGVSLYDACFLSAARVEGCSLITADAAFYRQAQSQPEVRWLGNY